MRSYFKLIVIVSGMFFLVGCSGSSNIEDVVKSDESIDEVVDERPITVSAERMEVGKNIYVKTCSACHQVNGDGIQSAFPPLASSDYLNEDVDRAIQILLEGKTGVLTVNGNEYNSSMAPVDLTDEQVADVLTFVYNSWGNNRTEVTAEMVMQVRSGK